MCHLRVVLPAPRAPLRRGRRRRTPTIPGKTALLQERRGVERERLEGNERDEEDYEEEEMEEEIDEEDIDEGE